ncbi:MAG TPA: hypothetical protein VNH63_01890 [Gemmatimonadales bacterium]|nr:hypothetical protein [Gemmatimonadales bacterium]
MIALMIPIVAITGFFGWMITLTITKAQNARLKAQAAVPDGGDREEVLAAVEELRREVAELAERVDFTERLLSKVRGAEQLKP